jgi:nucleoside-diphosphate-sugar epimerase
METGRNLIVVTGATGKQGGATVRELLAKGHKVRAMTRKPDSPAAREIAKLGAEIVAGDLDDAASLERSLSGAWGVFAVQNTQEAGVEREEEQGKRIAEIARRHGVQHYVYSSVASAHRNTGIPHFDNKWRVGEKVRALGSRIPSCARSLHGEPVVAAVPAGNPAGATGGGAQAAGLQMIAVSTSASTARGRSRTMRRERSGDRHRR